MKKIITICALAILGISGHAQMKDVTVTLQPTASYNWFDKNTAIEDGVMYGGRIGFGFGEAIELRGIYEKSANLKNTVDGLNFFSSDFVNNFNSRNVQVERIGGEFKANIPTRGTFVPFFTFGGGVQNLKVDVAAVNAPSKELKSEQIYVHVGLGTQIKLGTRIFLNLEAKNTIFNMNPSSVLYQEGQDQTELENWLGDNSKSRMYNWSVLAGLQLYLGGRAPEEYSALDRAYKNKFSGGLGGFKLIFEPAGAFVNFDNDTNFADSYFLGGKVGFDLNNYIGIRGYYFQATKDEKLSFDWDDMAMYGGDFVAKLNVSRGLVPYITLGGGYLNVNENKYIGKDGLTAATSGYFAKGGLGLNIPLGRNFEVFGDASMMFTSERATADLQNSIAPDELKKHVMYSAGLRFQLGKKADDTDDILQKEIDKNVDAKTRAYQKRIDQLESELSDAYKNNDTKKAVEIIEEKKDLEKRIQTEEDSKAAPKEAKSIEKEATAKKAANESRVEMTPKELEDLIEKVIQGVDEDSRKPQSNDERMDRLERLLLEVNTGTYRGNLSPDMQQNASQKIIDKLNELDRKIDRNTDRIDNLNGSMQNQNQDKTTIITSGNQTPVTAPQVVQSTETKMVTDKDGNTSIKDETENKGVAKGTVVDEGFSIFTGIAVANEVALTVGVRGNYSFSNTPFKFMPDLYLAPGKDTGFGVNANVVVDFPVNKGVILTPYAGLGLGYNQAAGRSTFSPNLVIGTSFNLLGGKLFADYTAHNFVDIHRISIGYKLNL
ncbi:hypothetical protein [Flavobacterium sp.]